MKMFFAVLIYLLQFVTENITKPIQYEEIVDVADNAHFNRKGRFIEVNQTDPLKYDDFQSLVREKKSFHKKEENAVKNTIRNATVQNSRTTNSTRMIIDKPTTFVNLSEIQSTNRNKFKYQLPDCLPTLSDCCAYDTIVCSCPDICCLCNEFEIDE